MIIERAFLRLLDILPVPWDNQYEATLAGHLAKAVLLELKAQDALMTDCAIELERAYPLEHIHQPRQRRRADLFVDLAPLYGVPRQHKQLCGYKTQNWIEAKLFRKSVSRLSAIDGASIVVDLLRICAFAWARHYTGGYVLLVFASKWPTSTSDCSTPSLPAEYAWLGALVSPGTHGLCVPFSEAGATFKRRMGPGFVGLNSAEFGFSVQVSTLALEPDAPLAEPAWAYWGYLSRIVSFKLRLGKEEFAWPSAPEISREVLASSQRRVAEQLLALLRVAD